MKKEVFDKMLNSGEFEQMFNENKINDLLNDGSLSKEQIDKLVDLGKKMSKDEILRRQRELSKQPGYKEHVLTPLIKKIIAQQGRARDPITGKYIKQEVVNQQKAEEQPQEQPQQENPNADRTAERAEQMGQKFKPKRMKNMFSGSRGATAKPATSKVNTELYSKIGVVQNPRLLKGDSVATVASKLYSIMKNDIDEYNVRSKLERKRDKQYLNNEVRRHNEIIEALNRAGGAGAGRSSKGTQSGMGMGTKLAIGAGLLGAAALARASEKPTPDVLPPEPKIDPPVPPTPAPAPPAPVPPKVDVEEEARRRQQEAEREAAAEQEKQKREQQKQQREAEQKQREAQQQKEAEEKRQAQEDKKKAEEEKKAAADEEARKQKEQEDEDKRKESEARAKAAREEKERKALEAEEKRKKDVAERIAKAEADNQKREAERLRREEEKTARENAARIKKEREDAEKEADAQKREAALQRKKQADAIAEEMERRRSQKGEAHRGQQGYQPPRNETRESPYDESIGRRYPKPIVTPSPAPPGARDSPYDESIGRRYPKPIVTPPPTAVPQFRTPGEAHRGQKGYTPVPAPAPDPAPVTRVTGTGPTGSAGKISEFNKRISEKIGKAEGGQNIPTAYNTMNFFQQKDGSGDIRKEYTDTGGKKVSYGTNIVQRGLYDISTAEWDGKKWDFSKAKTFTENLSEMSIGEVLKLQNARNDKFKGSSGGTAAGRYQFIRPTLANRAALLFGPNFRNVQFSEDIQEQLQNENLIELATSLKSAKIPITEKSLYMMHFDGLAFTKDVTNPANIDKLIKDLPSWSDTKTESNRAKAYTTVRKYLQSLSNFEDKSLNFEEFGKSLENFTARGIEGGYYKEIIRKRDKETYKFDSSIKNQSYNVIPSKQKSDKLSSVIIINNETTMLGSNNPRSGLSIPTSPDNSVYYPYTA